MTSELKPCPNPWCAENNVRHVQWELYRRRVFCTCGVKGPTSASRSLDGRNVDALDAEAILAWNTRAATPAPAVEPMADPRVANAREALEDMMALFSADNVLRKGAEVNAALALARAALAALDTPQ